GRGARHRRPDVTRLIGGLRLAVRHRRPQGGDRAAGSGWHALLEGALDVPGRRGRIGHVDEYRSYQARWTSGTGSTLEACLGTSSAAAPAATPSRWTGR